MRISPPVQPGRVALGPLDTAFVASGCLAWVANLLFGLWWYRISRIDLGENDFGGLFCILVWIGLCLASLAFTGLTVGLAILERGGIRAWRRSQRVAFSLAPLLLPALALLIILIRGPRD